MTKSKSKPKPKGKGSPKWDPAWVANSDGSRRFPSPFIKLKEIKQKFPKEEK